MNISACGWIAVGACFMALAVRLVYEPMSMVTGGFSGIGILVKHYIDVPVSVATFALNVPLFVWGSHVLYCEKPLGHDLLFVFSGSDTNSQPGW